MPLKRRIEHRLASLRRTGLHRLPPRIDHRSGAHYHLDSRPVVGFCSNDYLALADERAPSHPPTPAGASASRLICGELAAHRTLERTLADTVGAEDAVLFPSGFQLNVGVLPALLEAGDVAHSDTLNHASLIDGLRLARASVELLPHRATPPIADARGLRWWVTESIFSMDGDRASPQALGAYAAAGGCTYVDEAHAFGLFAQAGGLLGSLGIRPTVGVYTLSKAIGCAGAFAAADAHVCTWLRARARSFVFSTAISPALLPRIAHAVGLAGGAEGDSRRARLWSNADRLADRLGLDRDPPSPIFPLLVGPNQLTVDLAGALLDRGWHVQPIRPPTVPEGTARLRITVSAAHTEAEIDALARDLRDLLAAYAIGPRVERGRTRALASATA